MMARQESRSAVGPLAAGIFIAATLIGAGLCIGPARGDDAAGTDGPARADGDSFTPPLFGAPDQRIGAGSRELSDKEPCKPSAAAGSTSGSATATDCAESAPSQ